MVLVLTGVLGVGPGCKRPAPPAPAADAGRVAAARPDAGAARDGGIGTSGQHRAEATWVPSEFQKGTGRFRDPGVYVDGEHVGSIYYGELPSTLAPVWLDSMESLDFAPGQKGPTERLEKVRRYRIAEYLQAVGVKLEAINEVHLYGGGGAGIVLRGKDLVRARDKLLFGFGQDTGGKPLLYVPSGLKVNTSFDQVHAIAVYIKRKPPRFDEQEGEFYLDGKLVDGIPYFGVPQRGGVRVYRDDRLAGIIKRNKLAGGEGLSEQVGDELRWKLLPVLRHLGIKTDDLARAHLVYDERQQPPLDKQALATAYFQASPQKSGQMLFGAGKQPTEAILLFSSSFAGKQVARPEPRPDGKKSD